MVNKNDSNDIELEMLPNSFYFVSPFNLPLPPLPLPTAIATFQNQTKVFNTIIGFICFRLK